MTIEQSMVAALARHERAVQSVAEIKDQIGKALGQCSVEKEYLRRMRGWEPIDDLYDEKGRTKTHLWSALNECGSERRSDGEVIDYLADDETGCPHCAKAFDLILQRKTARQQLGVARRLIRHYGKRALAMQGGDA